MHVTVKNKNYRMNVVSCLDTRRQRVSIDRLNLNVSFINSPNSADDMKDKSMQFDELKLRITRD